jgi:hypothetical protein
MRVLILVLFFALPCFGAETIKATGTVRVRIVAPQEVEVLQPNAIVFTTIGATAQVVF